MTVGPDDVEATERMASKSHEYVDENDWVSLPEVVRFIGEAAEGAMELRSVADPNIVFWTNMSGMFIAALNVLIDGGVVKLVPMSHFSYLVDGAVIKLPLANRPPKGGYKEPHWGVVGLRPAIPPLVESAQ